MTTSKQDFDEMKARTEKAISNSRLRPATGMAISTPRMTQDASEAPKPGKEARNNHFDGHESDLHDLISAELRRRRWFFVRSRMDKRSTNQVGTPDFICAAPESERNPGYPRTFWIEVKRKGSKLTAEQTVTKHILLGLGHNYACVYSMDEFLEAIK